MDSGCGTVVGRKVVSNIRGLNPLNDKTYIEYLFFVNCIE